MPTCDATPTDPQADPGAARRRSSSLLEALDAPDALQWVEARTRETLARYGDIALARDRDIARENLDRPDRIPYVRRYGGLLYGFWKDAEHPRGSWQRTDVVSYATQSSAWKILFDLDALEAIEGEDRVARGLVGGQWPLPPSVNADA